MRLTTYFKALAVTLPLVAGCVGGGGGGDPYGPLPNGAPTLTVDITGRAQKGPFINGSQVRIAELSANLDQTGRVFEATILDDDGTFDVSGVALASPLVRLTADGFYFDEVSGELSAARLALSALADVTDSATVNVNILSHLEAGRVAHLIAQGQPFAEAKERALAEVLAVFHITLDAAPTAESLDIAHDGDADAALLAVSAILKGSRPVAEMSQLLSDLSSDLREDGVMDDPELGSALMNEATLLDPAAVRDHLTRRYETLGVAAKLGDFEAHVSHFLATSPHAFTRHISYPDAGDYGANMLAAQTALPPTNVDLSMVAEIPRATSLKVTMTLLSGWSNGIDGDDDGQTDGADSSGGEFHEPGVWWYRPDLADTWQVSDFDHDVGGYQEFVARPQDGVSDMWLQFSGTGSARIDFYENGADTPTFSREIAWEEDPS